VTEVQVVHKPGVFGEELRRRRLTADMALTELARQVHYSKGQLSKVERGVKAPSPELIRLCDAALDAGGELIALAPRTTPGCRETNLDSGDEEEWLTWPPPKDHGEDQSVSRRQVMAAGASIPAIGIRTAAVPVGFAHTRALHSLHSLFDHYRQLGQDVDARLMLGTLIAQVGVLRELSLNADRGTRRALLILGSRYAEYIGWLAQETGDEPSALSWTRHAADLAMAGGDDHMAAYGLVRHALITLYRGDAGKTIRLARQAQGRALPSRIRGLAAQREAQGHALAGDYNACMRSLDRASSLLANGAPDPEAPIIGSANLADSAEMIRGWCLYDLGQPRAAAEVIGSQLPRVPQQARRSQVRYSVRRALAYAAAGEVDHACQLTAGLLESAVMLKSATVATDLVKVARILARHPRNAAVRDLAPQLGTATHSAVP
jgi:transcriptional regulator with XRE-family HTH domain